MNLSRRQFNQWIGSVVAATACTRLSLGSADGGLNLGLNTWSLRALSQEEAVPVIIQVMKEAGLRDCQILFSHVEPAKFNPVFPVGVFSPPRSAPTPQQLEDRKKTEAALTAWRLSVPMSYFENIRSAFEKQGLRISSYAARLGSSEGEIDRQFLMAKSLGAGSINARIPESMTSVVAAAAEKQRLIVGIQFSDVEVMERQLATSKYFRMDPDIGDMTKAKMDALGFVQANYQSMSSLDLKDAVLGGGSVPFGEGDSRMKEVLLFLKEKQVPFTAYVDIDYAGTGRSREEVKKCVSYVRSITG
jgi:hypothetical protein